MPWFKVDDNLGFHHKVIAAGNPAMGLWVRAGSICAQQLTDGFVPDHMVAILGTTGQAKRLVSAGLWDRARGGYRFHGWAERQPSKASVEAERAAAADRMRQYRAKKKGTAQDSSEQVSDLRSDDVQANERGTNAEVRDLFSNPDPTHLSPDPTHPDPPSVPTAIAVVAGKPPRSELAIVGEVNAGSLVAEWIEHCADRPPSRVIGQVSKELKTLLGEGIDPDRIRRALAEWNRKGLHPSTLASVVHEIGNRAPAAKGQQATNDLFDSAMERAMTRDRNAQ